MPEQIPVIQGFPQEYANGLFPVGYWPYTVSPADFMLMPFAGMISIKQTAFFRVVEILTGLPVTGIAWSLETLEGAEISSTIFGTIETGGIYKPPAVIDSGSYFVIIVKGMTAGGMTFRTQLTVVKQLPIYVQGSTS